MPFLGNEGNWTRIDPFELSAILLMELPQVPEDPRLPANSPGEGGYKAWIVRSQCYMPLEAGSLSLRFHRGQCLLNWPMETASPSSTM